jgi:hypothetical protein
MPGLQFYRLVFRPLPLCSELSSRLVTQGRQLYRWTAGWMEGRKGFVSDFCDAASGRLGHHDRDDGLSCWVRKAKGLGPCEKPVDTLVPSPGPQATIRRPEHRINKNKREKRIRRPTMDDIEVSILRKTLLGVCCLLLLLFLAACDLAAFALT